jgi:hypothetical protein
MIPRSKTGTILILALILAGAAFLRLHRLGDRPLYFDEPHHTVLPATLPLPEVLRTNYGSVLYPALVHVLLPAGQVEAMARLPAAVFGILAVAVLFLIARHIFGKREAVVAALFAATSGPFIYFSQQARAYTGLLLFSLLALYFFIRAIDDNRPVFWAGYAVSMILGTYLHFFQLVLFPVHGSALVLWTVARWMQRLKNPETRGLSALRPLLGFSAAAAVSLAATYLLYLPTRNVSVGEVSFFGLLETSIRGLFGGQTGLTLLPFIRETFPRLLDYEVWPLLFFAKILLAAVGIVACLKGKSRELVLFLIYIILPFILFVFSNPADVYKSGQDNKFIFLTPILFLLMARGFSAIDDLAARKKPARAVWRVVFAIAVLLGEGAGLWEYRMTQWEWMSLPKNREVVSVMTKGANPDDMILSDGLVNPLAFIFVRPLDLPGTQRPGLIFFETGGEHFLMNHSRPANLWVLLHKRQLSAEAARRLESLSIHMDIRSIPPYTLIRHADPEISLLDKVRQWTSFFKTLPIEKDARRRTDLSRAYMNLITGRDAEALEILDTPSLRLTEKRRSFFQPRLNIGAGIEQAFHENINFYLIHNARLALDRGDAATAAELPDRILPADRRINEVRAAAHTLRAEAHFARDMKEDAVREYADALAYAPSPDVEARWIQRIGEIRGLPAGVLIRQSGGELHIRWWSDNRREFSGRLESSEPIVRVREFRLAEVNRYRTGDDRLDFTGLSRNRYVKGLTLITKRPARYEIRIRIPDLRPLENFLIVVADEENPAGLVVH